MSLFEAIVQGDKNENNAHKLFMHPNRRFLWINNLSNLFYLIALVGILIGTLKLKKTRNPNLKEKNVEKRNVMTKNVPAQKHSSQTR